MRNIEANHLTDSQAKHNARVASTLVVDQIESRAIRLQGVADEARKHVGLAKQPVQQQRLLRVRLRIQHRQRFANQSNILVGRTACAMIRP